jgi:hypothetical protein
MHSWKHPRQIMEHNAKLQYELGKKELSKGKRHKRSILQAAETSAQHPKEAGSIFTDRPSSNSANRRETKLRPEEASSSDDEEDIAKKAPKAKYTPETRAKGEMKKEFIACFDPRSVDKSAVKKGAAYLRAWGFAPKTSIHMRRNQQVRMMQNSCTAFVVFRQSRGRITDVECFQCGCRALFLRWHAVSALRLRRRWPHGAHSRSMARRK